MHWTLKISLTCSPVASAVIGLAAVPGDFPVSPDTQPDRHEGIRLPMSTTGYITSVLSTSSSVAVNVVATLAIVLRILASRRRTLQLEEQITDDIEKLVSPGDRDGMGSSSCTKALGTRVGDRGRGKNDRFVTVVAVLVESALPSAILGIMASLVHPMTPWSTPGIKPLLLVDARFSIRILWLASTVSRLLEITPIVQALNNIDQIMAPQAIMLRVLLRRDTHTRSTTAKEESLQFSSAPILPRSDTLVGRSSRSVDSLSLSPSLASAKDEGDSRSLRTIPRKGGPEYAVDGESMQLQEGNITKVERAQIST